MRNNLKVLDGLQEIDLRIDALKVDVKGLEDGIAVLERDVAEAQEAVDTRNAALLALEEEKRQLEESVSAESENIVRSEQRLKEIKTQKEYQAVSKEITSAKKLKVELEEQALQKISQIEEVRADLNSRMESIRELEQNVAARKSELQTQIDQLSGTVAEETGARDNAVKTLPSSIVKRYSLLREQRRGLAVVEAREGYCLGCNMNLPPQLYNSLYRGAELITCPHCQRILVLRQDLQQ
ncbi:zinc ribbon domain-containing protein [Geobacter sp. DSM 9736]|uniref:zinc ribbon domain-containing protein n=1 Tax=Geobacter sp. DSM 9736 TaxID=1277350 RepID=UPI000B512F6E|nr:C4-type zinc ribbon domain-containing protein [Geobacter sp. DSM 9736]